MGAPLRARAEHLALRVRARVKPAVNATAGFLAVAALRLVRRLNPAWTVRFAGRGMRRLGPWLPEHRVGRANLAAAFPEKSAAEIEEILGGVWDNLGRVAAEYAHLDRIWDFDLDDPMRGRIQASPEAVDIYNEIRDDGKPALVFAAHLANWELPALSAAVYGIDAAILYRQPNIGNIADAINRIRSVNMGTLVPTAPDAALRLAAALDRKAHVAMLVDQHDSRGVDVQFFGRTCKANPILARLARHYDCPIYGVRSIRMPDGRFLLDVTSAMAPVRDPDGRVDVTATMQMITSVVEGWVREHPEQWLWLHRRWR